MAEITQTILASPENKERGIYGNCLQAAIASLLDLPLEAVPHFSAFFWWDGALELWARGRGLTLVQCDPLNPPKGKCLVYGPSPRGVDHACVAENGSVIWDPHPSRAGLLENESYHVFEEKEKFADCPLCGYTGEWKNG